MDGEQKQKCLLHHFAHKAFSTFTLFCVLPLINLSTSSILELAFSSLSHCPEKPVEVFKKQFGSKRLHKTKKTMGQSIGGKNSQIMID